MLEDGIKVSSYTVHVRLKEGGKNQLLMYQNSCSDIQVIQAILPTITFFELTEWYQRLD